MADWDADDFEPQEVISNVKGDRWEGEDEEDVKESWEEEEEKKEVTEDTQSEAVKAFQKKKKKPLAERIAEKEAERLAAEKAEKEGVKELTPEEKLAEKLKIQKIQEESDLKLAKDAFGVMDAKSLDGMFPDTEEEFSTFRDALKSKITQFEKHKNYSAFIEKFIQDLLMDGNLEDLRRVTTSLTTLFHERQRQQKEQEKKKKKKTKTAIRAERDHDYTDIAAAARAEDFYEDDFI
ncbi:hypothetical protein CHS0354_013341 [Potamilus streckersoni]|uniref:Eukaryotic translation initiation factor 3 subunit J n=1 Tax=Potamilus streckersoni TaxID=2493646 RepID=A0AAE0T252_9BIVA|nr:hypothetical protein CHS0354_013341 [Potamilus streckersoni]